MPIIQLEQKRFLERCLMNLENIRENTKCRSGHGKHETLMWETTLSGEHYGIKDVPWIPKRLETKIKMEIFDWKKYENSPNYCPGDDAFSVSIFRNGVWEGYETSVYLDILHQGDKKNIVLDIGCQLGWYTVLAGLKGYKVRAFDFCEETIEVFWKNMKHNGITDKVEMVEVFIDEDTEPIKVEGQIEFLKCDIEGAEKDMYKATKHLFENKQVNYAMLEISPCFNDSYPKLCKDIKSHGYKVFAIPTKGFNYFDEYAEEPLKTIKKYCELSDHWLETELPKLRQENFLFIRNELI